MGDTEESNGNQRVTNAIIKRDIEHLTSQVNRFTDEVRKCNEDQEQRIRTLEGNQRSILAIIDNLEKRVNTWNITNSIGVVVAGVLAALGIQK